MSARLSVETVQQLESLIGGDPVVEQHVLDFIDAKYGARNLFFVPEKVVGKILERPDAFISAVKKAKNPFSQMALV